MSQKPVILIADDDPSMLITIKDILKAEPYELAFAKDGAEVLKLFYEKSPTILVLDLNMPGMGGLNILETLQPSPADSYSVFILTSLVSNTVAQACYQKGAQGLIHKPFNPIEFREIIKRAINVIKQGRLNDQNKDAYVDFIVNSSNCQTAESLTQFFFESFKRLTFEQWEPLKISIMTRNDGQEIGLTDQITDMDAEDIELSILTSAQNLGSLEVKLLNQALKEYGLETTEGHEADSPSVNAAWAIFWDLENSGSEPNGLAILVRNYPSLDCPNDTIQLQHQNIREEIENTVAKMLERVSEVMEKLSTQKKLQETNAVLERQKNELGHKIETIKKIVTFSVQEFQKIFDQNNENQEKQMELWENASELVQDSYSIALQVNGDSEEDRETRMGIWKNSISLVGNSFTKAMEWFAELQPGQQTFLINLTKLKNIYQQEETNENLKPGQMSEAGDHQQELVDDLLASLGL
ncbi:MAG: response regulator [SAR324 cluster bacterium]|nr:response regulator [SAR324 cluster bacterium]